MRVGGVAFPDEGVKTDLPVEGRSGRESLRAEPERAARTVKPPGKAGEAAPNKKAIRLDGCLFGALPGTRTLGPLIKR